MLIMYVSVLFCLSVGKNIVEKFWTRTGKKTPKNNEQSGSKERIIVNRQDKAGNWWRATNKYQI